MTDLFDHIYYLSYKNVEICNIFQKLYHITHNKSENYYYKLSYYYMIIKKNL